MNEIPARSHSVKADSLHQKSNPNSPNKTIGFKFNKSKKENNNNENMPNVSTTRKKLEKLNYKRGIDLLEVYKEKCRHLKIDMNKTNLLEESTSNIQQAKDEIKLKETCNNNKKKELQINDSIDTYDASEEKDEDQKSLEDILKDLKSSVTKNDAALVSNNNEDETDETTNESSTKKNNIIFV